MTPWRDGAPHAHIEVWKNRDANYRFERMEDPMKYFKAFNRRRGLGGHVRRVGAGRLLRDAAMNGPLMVACVQAEPVVLDCDASIEKLAVATAEAAGNGASLVVFLEAFLPAYPSSAWAKALAGWDDPRAKAAFALLARESVAVPGPGEGRIGEVAREHGAIVATGVTETDVETNGTLYNTLLVHDEHGSLVLKHRKLVPTNHERLVWGQGDGAGLRADERRTNRRSHLLGELHAARALRPLRVGRRDLPGAHGGRR